MQQQLARGNAFNRKTRTYRTQRGGVGVYGLCEDFDLIVLLAEHCNSTSLHASSGGVSTATLCSWREEGNIHV
jgi:hypothetical protein